jgi:hypothetical protein
MDDVRIGNARAEIEEKPKRYTDDSEERTGGKENPERFLATEVQELETRAIVDRACSWLLHEALAPSAHIETLICLCDNMINDCFHVLSVFPRAQLPICAGAFANDPPDVSHLFLAAEFLNLSGYKVEEFQ